MKNNEKINEFINNKKILFITPHLIYISNLLIKYQLNKEIFSFETIIYLFLILFTITTIIYFLLKIVIKNEKKVSLIVTSISLLYLCEYDWKYISLFISFGIIAFISLSVFTSLSIIKNLLIVKKGLFNNCICIIIMCIISYFMLSVPKIILSLIITNSNGVEYEEDFEATVEENLPTPNIYWVHVDGMMNIEDMNKYFNYYNKPLVNYLKENGYLINEDATLVANHKTQTALAAMFNPNYYDNVLGEYLYELEDVYLEKEEKTSMYISHKDITEKRFENELMIALKEKEYTTVGIAKFNNHTSLTTDIYYDLSNYDPEHWHFTETEDLRKITNYNIDLSYRIIQLKELLNYSMFKTLMKDVLPYEYELIDYNNIDTSNYTHINKTSYWQIKAIIKSLEETQNIKKNKFTFIDYDLAHTELSYDEYGRELEESNYYNIHCYLGNYIYTSKLLRELLEYIKTNDEEAIIIVQGDHGIHTIDSEFLEESLNITKEERQEIRNSVMNAVYIPKKYQNGDEKYLSNPLNIARYLVNNYVGKNYEYLEE